MILDQYTAQMATNAETIRNLLLDVSPEQARWKPAPDVWSILEVINHLYDEEREDFRAHLDDFLNHPDRPWRSIDPAGWVTARRYNERELQTSVDNFLQARAESLAWLVSLESPDWEATYEAPFGTIRAGDMFASWVAHDLLHMRQLVELLWAYTMRQLRPYDTRYAGVW